MRAAAVQFKATKGELDTSRARLVALTARAAEHADLVVLPEMAATGYLFADVDEAREVAEPADGPTFQALAEVARAHDCWIVCGFPEDADGVLYNSALVIDAEGTLQFVYRKTLLFEADELWAEPGNSGYRVFRTASGTFGVGICMDMNDPRFLTWLWGTPMDALAFPTNWIDEGADVWPYWAARIEGARTVLVAANTYGPEQGIGFSGRSAILDGRRILASAPKQGDAVIVGTW